MNRKYEKLTEYLYEILHKLQNQSNFLRHKDIAICLSNEKSRTDNTSFVFAADTIVVGLNHLKKFAAHSEDAVAAVLAHELSHKIFRHKYSFCGGKEEEIFADNYGLILCDKAGYNPSISLWDRPLSPDLNDTIHPQHKIRQLIMNRTAAKLSNSNIEFIPFREDIPSRVPLLKNHRALIAKRTKKTKKLPNILPLKTDLDVFSDTEQDDTNLISYLLSLKKLNAEHFFYIQLLDLSSCDYDNVVELYKKVKKSRSLSKDTISLQKLRDGLIQHHLLMNDTPEGLAILDELDSLFTAKTEEINLPQKRLLSARHLLNLNHRCIQKAHRQKVYDIFANTLKELYGTDDSSAAYGILLENQLRQLSGKIHNSDVLPLSQTLQDTLNITENHRHVLQNFAKNNSFEVQQIRTELLITECLLNGEQALQTVKYLISDNLPPFQFEGIYDKSSQEVVYSLIDDTILKDIHDDWATISPNKRADIFMLLMQNIPSENAAQKLDLFVDKKDDESFGFKPVVEAYLDTYPPEKQNDVVATLVSLKDIDKPFGYEEYFKTILQNSGIKGKRLHDRIYKTNLSAEIESKHRSYEPIYAEGEIVYANLDKWQKSLLQTPDTKTKRSAKQMQPSAPPKSAAKTYS